MSINSVTISGNLTRDCVMRQTQGGTAILSFTVAVNERRKNQQTGDWEDVPNFIDCSMFGKRAEAVSRYLSKGSKVAVFGKLHWSQWEKDGQKRSKVEVVVDEVEFMSRQSQGEAQQGQYQQQAANYSQQPQTPPNTAPQQFAYSDSEIPF